MTRGRSDPGRPRARGGGTRDRRLNVRRPGWWFWGPFLFGLCFTAGGVLFLLGSGVVGEDGERSSGLDLTGVIWLAIGVVGLVVAAYARHDIRSPDEPPRVAGRPDPDQQRRLRATGVPGRATISSFKYLGRHLDGETLVELGLSVVVGGAAHDTVDRLFVPVPVARRLAVGATVPVTVAPGHPDRFAVDWSGLGATS